MTPFAAYPKMFSVVVVCLRIGVVVFLQLMHWKTFATHENESVIKIHAFQHVRALMMAH